MVKDITNDQRSLIDEWLGDWYVLEDLSWPLQDTTVLQVSDSAGRHHIVKASTTSSHIEREIRSHLRFLAGRHLPVPELEHSSLEAGILICTYLPGTLVQGSDAEWEADTYRQAGSVLSRIQVPGPMSDDYRGRIRASALSKLGSAVGLVPGAHLDGLGVCLDGFASGPVRLHFTHGDFGPRNWLVNDGTLSVIDFGRGAQRSWVSDLVRLRNQQFVGRPELEAAFHAGLGRELDADDRELLTLETIDQALGTVIWAHQVGDAPFEQHGRTMIARIVEPSRPDPPLGP